MAGANAADCARQAGALAAEGKDGAAEALFEQGLAQFPGDARLANSAGNFHARARRDERAVGLFERALGLDPSLTEAAVNASIVLLRLKRPRRAAQLLAGHGAAPTAQYWALRSDAAKALGDFCGADAFLARAEAIEPTGKRILPRRARLALERGDTHAAEHYEAALRADPGNFALMQGYMEALDAAGRRHEALDFGAAVAAHFPSWAAGQAALAELRWAAGDPDFTDHFEAATAAHPAPESYLEWARMLSGNDRHAAAADVLGRAHRLWPEHAGLRLELAVAFGEAGQPERAAALLAAKPEQADPDWQLVTAWNDLRLDRVEASAATLEELVITDAANMGAWALLDVCWRRSGDGRHVWLHGQPGLVRELELPLDRAQMAAAREVLRDLHAASAMPLAQSVKGGTQTRGALLARTEPELGALASAIDAVLAEYRAGLPPADAGHPLLSRRDDPWMIAGSWSVRFVGSGCHSAHIHPRGLLSSACYFIVPGEVDASGGPGWLELGRPPENIAHGLDPLHAIRPREGMCALFPSTLFHGTRPLHAGERMTVAFDVVAAAD